MRGEPAGTTARWAIALCISVLVAFGGWAYSTVQGVRNHEMVRAVEKVDGLDYLVASQTARIQAMMTQLDAMEKMVRENNALLIKYLARND